ncbi:MAG: hypothetical protein GX133_07885 [Syntrophomonadaceae bacterium]|nr:hypothetical protein [Syntrophomonadaceae bacterium]
MMCPQCGADSAKNINFCTECGTALVMTVSAPLAAQPGTGTIDGQRTGTSNLIGYSERINDTAFARYVKNSHRWAAMFSVFIAVAAVVGFYIAGEVGSEMDNPESLHIGFGIGGMFLAIALFQIMGRSRSKAWDGVVIDKKTEKKRRQERYGNEERWVRYTRYTVIFKTDTGKNYEINADDDDTKYNYYRIGDRVRYHKGLNSIEKFDKSGDSIIFCNACASLNDINDDLCFRCSCPLLK